MELVENNNANDDILEKYDVYILPVANPDGYVSLKYTTIFGHIMSYCTCKISYCNLFE